MEPSYPSSNSPGSSIGELLARLLEDYEQALAAGDGSAFLKTVSLPPEVTERWQQVRTALEYLKESWPDGTASSGLPLRFGRFRVEAELGRGSFGIVYRAHDPRLNRAVALKVPRLETMLSPELLERFTREAQAAASLDHPGIVAVHEAGADANECFIVSAYCPGPTLARRLKESSAIAPRVAALLMLGLAEAIQHAHERGVLHRDLKPSNILFGESDQERWTPRITDFGLAKVIEQTTDLSRSSLLLGTPCYMAPEQAGGWASAIGPHTDVYALGVIMYEVLTSRPPFVSDSVTGVLDLVRNAEPLPPRTLTPSVPVDLQTICLKCLEKSPRDRYAKAVDLADDLRRYLADEPIRARPVGWVGRFLRWVRRPQRVRDAGILAVGTELIVPLWLLILAILAPAQVHRHFDQQTLQQSYVFVLVYMLALWVGYQTMQRRPWAIWGGMAFATAFWLMPVLVVLGFFHPFEGLYRENPVAHFLVYAMLVPLVSVSFLAYLAGAWAYWNHRENWAEVSR